jgi:hypothetical protein
VKRRLFNLLAGVSLVLCVAMVVMWVRSYWRSDQVQTTNLLYDLDTSPGRVWITKSSRPYWSGIPYLSRRAEARFGSRFHGIIINSNMNGTRTFAAGGFVYFTYVQPYPPPPCRFTEIGIPFWFISLVAAAPLTIWLRFRLTRKQYGFCAACGYDLRATPNRCPECGTVPRKEK